MRRTAIHRTHAMQDPPREDISSKPYWQKFLDQKHMWEKKNGSQEQIRISDLWQKPPSSGYRVCVNASSAYQALKPNSSRGFLLVSANGGLNQMRAGICDMVVISRILNATLVIPRLDATSYWQDDSGFGDIFDEKYFIEALRDDVEVVRKLPEDFRYAEEARFYFQSWSDFEYYRDEIGKNWLQYKVLHALKSDSRLTNNKLSSDLQKLRCRTHFEALRFAPEIEELGQKLVHRMRSHGPYIALHLRYEKDMLAFSGCTYGLSVPEIQELEIIRMSTKHWRDKDIDSAAQRVKGLCPLSPGEVGMLLVALGFPNTTRIYVASGEIYGGEKRMENLKSFYPHLFRKESLASEEELDKFKSHMNIMAALDYIVAIESDVFLPTYSGNMAKAVEGHRRYLGHRKTLSPNSKEIVRLFDLLDRGELEWGPRFWEAFELAHMHRRGSPRPRNGPVHGTYGKEKLRTEESFYSNPLPDCICQGGGQNRLRGRAMAVRRCPLPQQSEISDTFVANRSDKQR